LSSGPNNDIDELIKRDIYIYDIGPLVNNPFHLIRYIYRIVASLKNIRPFIVFTFTIRPNLFGSLIASSMNIPVVSNITGTGPVFEKNNIVFKLARFLYRFAFKKNQTIFFQNQNDFTFFVQSEFVSLSQAILLPGSGVDTMYYSPSSKSKEKPFTFLMISRLIKDKGVLEYVEAAKILKEEFPNIRFELLGPFWTQNLSKNTITASDIASWQDQGIIQYLGQTLDVRPYIADSDCIVLPSYREGNSNVLMQGASMAKPCIASDVVGCNNLILDGISGYLCQVKNVEDLALKMRNMINLDHTKRLEMGTKGREYIQANYPKSIVLDAYMAECNKVIK
jgi:glycosyltransferase involved in cell wall biosynthesis